MRARRYEKAVDAVLSDHPTLTGSDFSVRKLVVVAQLGSQNSVSSNFGNRLNISVNVCLPPDAKEGTNAEMIPLSKTSFRNGGIESHFYEVRLSLWILLLQLLLTSCSL